MVHPRTLVQMGRGNEKVAIRRVELYHHKDSITVNTSSHHMGYRADSAMATRPQTVVTVIRRTVTLATLEAVFRTAPAPRTGIHGIATEEVCVRLIRGTDADLPELQERNLQSFLAETQPRHFQDRADLLHSNNSALHNRSNQEIIHPNNNHHSRPRNK